MKMLKKVTLFTTIIGFISFLLGGFLERTYWIIEVPPIKGLSQLTVLGAIVLGLAIIVWLIIFDWYVFTGWNWLKTKTKYDDVFAIALFTIVVPVALSIISFTVCNLVVWYEWYMAPQNDPLYYIILTDSLDEINRNLIFWLILISSISISSGLAIFLYKFKKIVEQAEDPEGLMKKPK